MGALRPSPLPPPLRACDEWMLGWSSSVGGVLRFCPRCAQDVLLQHVAYRMQPAFKWRTAAC
jgi:hypothetical protein